MAKGRISKYEKAIVLLLKRSRGLWECQSCGNSIQSGDYYYRQSLGLIRKPPNVILNAFCLDCGESPQSKVLDTGKGVIPHQLDRNRPLTVGFDSCEKPLEIQLPLF